MPVLRCSLFAARASQAHISGQQEEAVFSGLNTSAPGAQAAVSANAPCLPALLKLKPTNPESAAENRAFSAPVDKPPCGQSRRRLHFFVHES
jgi:hypothetical protein